MLNNPLRYIDPTGRFTDEAIKIYLREIYGDAWEQYWQKWSVDLSWLDLLHAAQGGDILSHGTWTDGSLDLDYFMFGGSGHDVLSGVYRVGSLTAEPQIQDPERASLWDMYSNQGAGISVLHFGEDGTVNLVGLVGETSVVFHTVTRSDVRMRGFSHWLIITGLGKAFPPLGLTLGAIKALSGPEIGEWPGMKEGDIELMMGFAVDMNEVLRVATYETVFRNGQNLGRNGVWDGITTINRPKTWDRRY